MKTLTSKQLGIAAGMVELRDGARDLLGPADWARAVATYGPPIREAMLKTDNHNPLAAVIPLAKAMQAAGKDPGLLMAVAVDLSEM